MSADNTIVVLETEGPEFRVCEVQVPGLPSLEYTLEERRSLLLQCFGEALVFTEEAAAMRAAFDLHDEFESFGCEVEYGVRRIRLPERFPEAE
jgi:hypothetical protein